VFQYFSISVFQYFSISVDQIDRIYSDSVEYINVKCVEGHASDYTLTCSGKTDEACAGYVAITAQHPVTAAGCDTARKTKNSSPRGAIICYHGAHYECQGGQYADTYFYRYRQRRSQHPLRAGCFYRP